MMKDISEEEQVQIRQLKVQKSPIHLYVLFLEPSWCVMPGMEVASISLPKSKCVPNP